MKNREREFGLTDEEIAKETNRRDGLKKESDKIKKAVLAKLTGILTDDDIKWLKENTGRSSPFRELKKLKN